MKLWNIIGEIGIWGLYAGAAIHAIYFAWAVKTLGHENFTTIWSGMKALFFFVLILWVPEKLGDKK